MLSRSIRLRGLTPFDCRLLRSREGWPTAAILCNSLYRVEEGLGNKSGVFILFERDRLGYLLEYRVIPPVHSVSARCSRGLPDCPKPEPSGLCAGDTGRPGGSEEGAVAERIRGLRSDRFGQSCLPFGSFGWRPGRHPSSQVPDPAMPCLGRPQRSAGCRVTDFVETQLQVHALIHDLLSVGTETGTADRERELACSISRSTHCRSQPTFRCGIVAPSRAAPRRGENRRRCSTARPWHNKIFSAGGIVDKCLKILEPCLSVTDAEF